MTPRFRMIAGPNGSGKSTLTALLRNDYAVNFYTLLNADEIFAEVSKSHSFSAPVPVDQFDLLEYAIDLNMTRIQKNILSREGYLLKEIL